MKASITSIIPAAVVAVGGSVLFWAIATKPPRPIPAAAASEAALVCQPFDGLDTFTVEQGPPSSDATTGTPLQRYRVTATCKSEHTITGNIAIPTK